MPGVHDLPEQRRDRAALPAGAGAGRLGRRGARAGSRGLEGFGRIAAQAAAVRAAAGSAGGRGPETVALTANTTHGLNLVAWGIDWRPGDEIVTTALEHPGVTVPLAVVARRTGAAGGRGRAAGGDLEVEVGEVAGPRTRLVALSHVSLVDRGRAGRGRGGPRPARRAP